MPKGKMVLKGYYSPAQAMSKLGASKDMLATYVRNERLKKVVPPGRKQGVFDREQVDDLARELAAFVASSGIAIATFEPVTPDDMEECARLVNAVFGVYPNIAAWTQWIIKNSEVGYLLRSDDKVVGCAFLLPLTPEKIDDILAHEITPLITYDDVQLFSPSVPTHLYVRTVGVQPGMSREAKRLYGSRLVANLIKLIITLGKRGVDIKTITSRSETPDGIRILRHMGFAEMPSITNHRNFVIDVASSGIPQIMDYKEALENWKRNTEQVSNPYSSTNSTSEQGF